MHTGETIKTQPARHDAAPGSSVDHIVRACADWLLRIRTRTDLLAAELELAARSGAAIIVLSLGIAGLVLSGWLLLMLVAGYQLIQAGVPPGVTGFLLIAIQAFGAAWMWHTVRTLSREMTLPRSRSAGATQSGSGQCA